MGFENSSSALQLTATIQKEGHCSVISKWGTPKTPAPSGPLTLYVGPSRDAGRLRARQDRHRAAAPALSNGDGLSKQTHSAVLARGLGAGRAFAASGGPLCWRAADHPRRLSITSIPSRSSRPTCHALGFDRGDPTRSSLQVVSKLPSDLSDSLGDLHSLSRSSSLCFKAPRGHFARVPGQAAAAKPPRPKRPPSDLNFLPPGPQPMQLQSIAL